MKRMYNLFAVVIFGFTACMAQNNKPMVITISANGHQMTATLADNTSAQALVEMLQDGSVTINMHDYANFEKVGSLPHSLPTNDEQITTTAGDLILYMGTQFVIYYDTNSWNFTRLGRINNVSQAELKQILGTGDVTVTLTLNTVSGINTVNAASKSTGKAYHIDGRAAHPGDKGIIVQDGKLVVK